MNRGAPRKGEGLTEDQIVYIRANRGLITQAKLAKSMGVAQPTIGRIQLMEFPRPPKQSGGSRKGAGRKPNPNKPARGTLSLKPRLDTLLAFRIAANAGNRSLEGEFERMVRDQQKTDQAGVM